MTCADNETQRISLADIARLLVLYRALTRAAAMEGFDPLDSTSIPDLAPSSATCSFDADGAFSSTAGPHARRVFEGLTIGMPMEYDVAELSPAVRAAWFRMAEILADESGARVVTTSLPHTRHALPAYYVLAPAEAMSNLARYDGVRYGLQAAAGTAAASTSDATAPSATSAAASSLQAYYTSNRSLFGAEVQRRILVGSFVLSHEAAATHFTKAQRVRAAVTSDFVHVFTGGADSEKIDLLLTPTSIGTAMSFEQIKREATENPVSVHCRTHERLGIVVLEQMRWSAWYACFDAHVPSWISLMLVPHSTCAAVHT
jgi:Asp-tRNA(Asn)/Glu-tRNA(Gln) amidotransferase A subunit family amidase